MDNSKRNIALDLLRVVAMIMIVTLHVMAKGKALSIEDVPIKIFAWTLEAFCFVAVNVYVLISGYFLVDSKFKVKKVFILWGEVLFYSWTIFAVAKVCGDDNIGLRDLVYTIFPVLTKENYWFITVYLLLYVLSPFINVMINNISKKQHFNLCLILIVFFSIISFLLPHDSLIDSTCGTGIIWFVSLYIVAAYIKKYIAIDKTQRKLYLFSYIMFSLLTVVFLFGCELIVSFLNMPNLTYGRIYSYSPFFVFMASVSLFMLFRTIDIRNYKFAKVISLFAPLTFGVYLIHEHVIVRKHLYKVVNLLKYRNLNFGVFIVVTLGFIIAIYLMCSLVEYVRMIAAKRLAQTKKIKHLEIRLTVCFSKIRTLIGKVFYLM